ncbi:oligomeric golgi complex component, COG2-domain-containing protein [Lentinula raphanica]|nr:oligomeric golgi complex component, COG2-domain-containing protein [Lentinula raphanica]
MSILSPKASAPSDTDPYQLERLAEELATREKTHPALSDSQDGSTHDLPIYIPLSHENPYLSKESFDVEAFLLSRSHTTLQDLRTELRDYLATLKEELVKLINDDYEAFISLSTDLKGEGERLTSLILPLDTLKSEISISKAELRAIEDEVIQKLERRTMIREEKALLHLLLKISESVTRLESLLSIVNPNQDDDPIDYERFKVPSSNTLESSEERSPANKAKHLNRAAAEYMQLLYHASKARSEHCAFVDEIQWKIDRIQSSLSSDLDALFASTLSAMVGDAKPSELEKNKILPDLTECIKTYDVLSLWRDAEEILRSVVMRPFIRKTVFAGALSAPHSPLLPHTPFRSSMGSGFSTSSSLVPPRTPFTPFTAFSSQQSAFPSGLGKAKSPHSRLLDDSDDPLAKLYTQILRFVERDFSNIMDIAEKVSIKSRASTDALEHERRRRDGPGFDIMANVIWNELGRAIMDDLGSMVFASGRPDEFRKNYEITQAFIRSLEFLASSAQAVRSMRAHPVYAMFEKRWQLPVYFQMRWKEIVNKVEEALVLPAEPSGKSSTSTDSLLTPQATAIWIALTACWSAEIYIPELSHRFWRLTLQLLSRYRVWLNEVVQDGPFTSANPINTGKISEANSRVPTPGLPERHSIDASSTDESLLIKYVSLIADIKTLQSSMMTLWNEEICVLLPESEEEEENDDEPKPQDALENAIGPIVALIIPMSSTIIAILTERCAVPLNAVKKIRTDLRAKANKQLPTEPHPWVPSILRPLKVFFGISGKDGVGAILKAEYLSLWSRQVFENVVSISLTSPSRYIVQVSTLKKAEESLRRLKRGTKSTTFSLFGSNNATDADSKDEERIRAQLMLDVEAFGKDAKTLGIVPEDSEAFIALRNLVLLNEREVHFKRKSPYHSA